MTDKLTPKQEAFCQEYLKTGNASEAYRRSYDASKMKPEVIHVKSSELLSNGKVTVRIKKLRRIQDELALISKQAHLKRLEELSKQAEAAGQFNAAITAEVNRGKVSGLYVDKVDHMSSDGSMSQKPSIIEIVGVDAKSKDSTS